MLLNSIDHQISQYYHSYQGPVNFKSTERMGVVRLIENLKLSAFFGVDATNSKMLKNTKLHLSILLAALFMQSLYFIK